MTFVDFVAPNAAAPRSPARDIPSAHAAAAPPPPHGGSWGSASGGGGSATAHGLLASYDVALTDVEAQMDAAICTALDSSNFGAVFHCIAMLGASVNYARRRDDGCTALIAAAACGDGAVARNLIEMGADVSFFHSTADVLCNESCSQVDMLPSSIFISVHFFR